MYNLIYMDKKKALDSITIPSQDWESYQKHETNLLRGLTIREGIQQYQEMRSAFEWQMQQTANLFEENHRRALIELQARLHQLSLWLSIYGQSSSLDPEDSKIAE
jgi:hypothetical protein